jgi:hypothetical protein
MEKLDQKWQQLASDNVIEKVIANLITNNFSAEVVENKEQAKKRFFEILPENAQVMNYTSQTLEISGIAKEILESGRYNSIRKAWENFTPEQAKQKKYMGAVPDWGVGSVHAITEQGQILVASGSGSQIPAYVYGASKIIWVVGTQKIVADIEQGRKRLEEYCWPLESNRTEKAHGYKSNLNKILQINKDSKDRIHTILVKENLGF